MTRPHFHVKPLDDSQLSAWSEYIDFEQAQATQEGEEGPGATARAKKPTSRKRPRGGGGGNGGVEAGGARGKGGVERLFERCLVPCASYWWLWERYALWKVDRRFGLFYVFCVALGRV